MSCSFLPPYLLQTIGAAGRVDPSVVRRTLVLDQRLRVARTTAASTMRQPAVRGEGQPAAVPRVVHDAQHGLQLPGVAVRAEGDRASGDSAADEAFVAAGRVVELFSSQFHRQSVDGNGSAMSITVHYGQSYDNAFFDGAQLVFGDGDEVLFRRFTTLDVLAHEFTHGVTQFTAALAYDGQPGALNESVSDVFAALAQQRLLAQTADRADWLIGAGIFAPGVRALALRSMADPGSAYDDPRLGRDRQVGAMVDYVDTEEDSGGVHINSGIPNQAFATAARAIGGYSWEHAGQVWYDALTSGEVTANSDFAGFAAATISSARRLFPRRAAVAEHVRAAWTVVGVHPSGSSASDPVTTSDPSTTSDSATPAAPSPQRVAVSRSGGFTGITRSHELDLDTDPEGLEVRTLLSGIDLNALASSSGGADRFVYTVEYGSSRVTVGEQDLTPELHRVVQLVLSSRR